MNNFELNKEAEHLVDSKSPYQLARLYLNQKQYADFVEDLYLETVNKYIRLENSITPMNSSHTNLKKDVE